MGNGLTIELPAREKSSMLTKTSMRATSLMERNMVKVCITTKQEENTKESGSMIKSMGTESSTMQTETNTKEIGEMDRELITGSTNTPTEMFTMENGETI